jgi:hypothetical protein
MRQIIEVSDEGFESLLGETVTCFCMNYFYTGKLVGVNDTCVKLDNPKIVYETGAWDNKKWADAQPLPGSIYVQLSAVEAFGLMK